jgi:hypothetical protein
MPFSRCGSNYHAVELLLLLLFLGNLRRFPELYEVAHSVRFKTPP